LGLSALPTEFKNEQYSDTQARILQAASLMAAEFSLGELRVDRVCERASANKRMVYHYFGSKNGLLEAVVQQQVLRLKQSQGLTSLGMRVLLALYSEADKVKKGAVVNLPIHSSAKIVHEDLLRSLSPNSTTDRSIEIPTAYWLGFIIELGSLALLPVCAPSFGEDPETKVKEESERLLKIYRRANRSKLVAATRS